MEGVPSAGEGPDLLYDRHKEEGRQAWQDPRKGHPRASQGLRPRRKDCDTLPRRFRSKLSCLVRPPLLSSLHTRHSAAQPSCPWDCDATSLPNRISCPSNASITIDRFDARGHLDSLPPASAPAPASSNLIKLLLHTSPVGILHPLCGRRVSHTFTVLLFPPPFRLVVAPDPQTAPSNRMKASETSCSLNAFATSFTLTRSTRVRRSPSLFSPLHSSRSMDDLVH